MADEIAYYIDWPEKNVFYYRPVTYKYYVVLLGFDQRDSRLEWATKYIARKIDGLTGHFVPLMEFVALTEDAYKYETVRNEPFKFVR
jgi:hypothetical protein